MADFSRAVEIIFDFEGGYTNDPADKGGATKFGITLGRLKEHKLYFDLNHDKKITKEDVKLLTKDDAKKIYKMDYWAIPFRLDEQKSEKKALLLFDLCVNHGPTGAVALVQKALNAIGEKLAVDGVYGPKTAAAIDKYDDAKFIDAVLDYREKFYRKIVQNSPSQKKFLNGWINHRVKRLAKILETY